MINLYDLARTLAGDREPQKNSSGGYLTLCPCHEDKDFSLSISQTPDGKFLYHCFGDCSQEILTAWFKDHGYLSSNGNGYKAAKKSLGEPVKIYPYHDAGNKLVFQVCRYQTPDGKTFRQRRPDGKGGWIWKMTGVKLVPYRLPEVLEAETVAVCEGEKACDSMAALGFTATTNAGGAKKWRPDYAQYFQGKKVAIFPDNDDPGRGHAQDVARNLHGVAAIVKIVDLPGLPLKGDVVDWVKAGGSAEQLQAIVKAAPEWKPETTPQAKEAGGQKEQAGFAGGHNLTDLGNSRRLVALYGQNIRYCYPWSKWLFWDDKKWARDETGEIERIAKSTVKAIYGEASEIEDKKQRQAVAQHAMRSESERRRKAMIAGAQSEAGVPILPEHMDPDPWLFNVLNGTLELKKGKLRPHARQDLITKMAEVEYDPIFTCPNFLAFLKQILPPQVIIFLQKAIGYSMTGCTAEQVLFFLYGLGANGKSTLLEVLQTLFSDYATQSSTDTFLVKPRGSGIPNDVAALKGARFVVAAEVEAGRRMAEVLIKQLTGGDKVSARFMHGEFFEFKPAFKLWWSGNHKPVIRGTDHAIWRRIRLFPFTVQIPEGERDRNLAEKLKSEFPGILNWALAGCLQWQYGGLEPPKEIFEATQGYREEMDTMADFLAERCFVSPAGSATARDLYAAFTKWSTDAGEKHPMPQRSFGMALTERGFERRRGTGGRTVWTGIAVKDE